MFSVSVKRRPEDCRWLMQITTRATANKEPAQEFQSTAILPYIKGVSADLQGIRTVFKSDTTLRSHSVRPKDAVEPSKQDGIVYKIPCECGKMYIGETGRSMRERLMEHDRDILFTRTQTSAVSKYANTTGIIMRSEMHL